MSIINKVRSEIYSFSQVKDYDSISRIDAWLTGLLLHIKKAINAVPDIN